MLNKLKLRLAISMVGLIGFVIQLPAQTEPQAESVNFNRHYKFLQSGNTTMDKNFYLLTILKHYDDLHRILNADLNLKHIGGSKQTLIASFNAGAAHKPATVLEALKWSSADSLVIESAIKNIYHSNARRFDQMIDQHLRPSGYYRRYHQMNNEDLFLYAWRQYIYGTNYIIDQYGLGKKLRYPTVDSANYDVKSSYYIALVNDMLHGLKEDAGSMQAFYEPTFFICAQLMNLNDRDEPANATALEAEENRAAMLKVKRARWANYRYSAILIPGNGPILSTTPISPVNKVHCDIAVKRFKSKLAPFIIVSGGSVYPFRGPYVEAMEMKKYLVQQHGIPPEVVIIEAQARHTTTNFRNANRLIYRYGIPAEKPVLFTSSKSQIDFVALPSFDQRNIGELGYVPYQGKRRISDHDIVFYPVPESLHMDPLDPLDP
jgi:hypothetical protein